MTTQKNPQRLDAFETFVKAGSLAPSGDNLQPWRFEIASEESRLTVHVDESRDTSPMNAGQTMSRIAVGAAAENIVRTIGWNQGTATVQIADDGSLINIMIDGIPDSIEIDSVVRQRVTNRRVYKEEPISPSVLSQLHDANPCQSGVTAHFLIDSSNRSQIIRLITAGDQIMFGNNSLREAFLKNVRFDAAKGHEVHEGLSLESLEMTPADERAFRLLPKLPHWILRLMGIGRAFAKKTKLLAGSASGFCLITALDDTPATDVVVGRSMQRAWLTLTELGLAAQPMMSILVLKNALQHGSEAIRHSLNERAINELVGELLQLFGVDNPSSRPAFLLRFGKADPTSGRCGRRPTSATKPAASVSIP